MRIGLLVALLSLAATSAVADDIASGRVLAEINCARCHAIGGTGDSPFPAAPPFRMVPELCTDGELEDAFNDGLAVGHPAMPDWDMTADQARGFAAFIMSFGTAKQ